MSVMSSPHRAAVSAGVVLGVALLAGVTAPARADVTPQPTPSTQATQATPSAQPTPSTQPTQPPDVTAPVAQVLRPNTSISDGIPLRLQWTATDPAGAAGALVSGVATYDVRYRQAFSLAGQPGPWQTPAEWQATTATDATLTVPTAIYTCVQVRARDVAGNLGDWSGDRCTTADSTPPNILTTDAGPLVVPAVTKATVTFRWSASDDYVIPNYDVMVRTAPVGAGLGAWTTPAGLAALAASKTKVSVSPGEESCFTVRGRDGVGHLSGWGETKCASVPVDDRWLRPYGKVARLSTAPALGATTTALLSAGSELTTAGTQTGAQVGLVVLRGPGQGIVDIYAGTTRLGRISLAATGWTFDTVVVSLRGFSKQLVKVRSVANAPARIDALAVLR